MAVRLCLVVDVAALVDATDVLARNRVSPSALAGILGSSEWLSGKWWKLDSWASLALSPEVSSEMD
jgi:hypothetical protein